MPELPEVETIVRYLDKNICGKKVTDVLVLSKKQFPQDSKLVIGAKILSVSRRGKNTIISLSNGKTMIVHLRMTGQLILMDGNKEKYETGKVIPLSGGSELPARSTRVIISLNGGKLFFNESRKFGAIRVVSNAEADKEADKLGPEPFGKDFSIDYLTRIFKKTAKPIKALLLDQEKIAGIGNIYASEILFEAKINPKRPAKGLNRKEIIALYCATLSILKEAIKYGGSSASDEAYIQPDTSRGLYQDYARVYQRDGQLCRKCKALIKRVVIGGRGTFYCPNCQK
ncbi:MAG: bifunctional DNA-formamidopyrimidine glycosylase/DNA-(apurinic or apyrimidinic site) lyase [bacterium]